MGGQLIGMAATSQLKAKELQKWQDELVLRTKELNAIQHQMDSSIMVSIRNAYLQCINWAIDRKADDSIENILARANELYEAMEGRVNELCLAKINEINAKAKENPEAS